MFKITFLGATETVTGSCYLVQYGNSKFLIDCGLFQGEDVYKRNFDEFDFNASEIDFVVLTHAHMDHSGLLPKLFRKGFTGKIYTTPPTTQLAEILLLDAAKIQESNYSRDNQNGNTDIIYTTFDSLNAIAGLVSVDFDEEVNISEDIKFTFRKAGHILGASSVFINLGEKKIVFSGDLGRVDEAIIESFINLQENKYNADYVVMESLYGGVVHQTRPDATNELINLINETIKRGGNVVIPSFAVHKTQEILEILKEAFAKNLIDQEVQVVLDSPLAIKATSIYSNNTTFFDPVKYNLTDPQIVRNIFNFPNLKVTRTHKQSLKSSNKIKSIFIAGSGMAEGGRVIRHLINNLPHKNNMVIFVGYQAEGTKGREILEGQKEIELDRKRVKINADIKRIEGFSSHGDHNDLLEWLKNFDQTGLKKVFLTHADPDRSEAFKTALDEKGITSYIPKWKEVVELD
ncbi:MBL fold metallo-hydrolase [Candidatus Dojkabacteria bacterium]|uniref:MBL fold metallo-hydrolase n=1 Tax=Candidatus Dojkabacteria bacterium TaxID=2099670 RepID=A0A955KZW7_9BACT|nr:MBL fold metallo-hydrolase [Candidatus Dojkabacteria bacterium]